MKLLFLSHYGELLGANRSLLSLLKGLKNHTSKNIKSFVVVAGEGEFTEELKKNDIEFEIIPFLLNMQVISPKEKGFKKIFRSLFFKYSAVQSKVKNEKAILKILKWVEQKNIDVVHSNASVFDVGQFLANALRVPHIQHFREFGDKDYFLVPYTSWQNIRQEWQKLDAKIVISKAIQNHHFPTQESRKDKKGKLNTFLIYNGIFEKSVFEELKKRFEQEQNNPQTETNKPFIFTILGLLHPAKGQAEAIKAFAEIQKKYPNTVLQLIGKSNFKGYQEELESLVKEYSLEEKVIFEGYISNPITKLLESDVLLMCSTAEGMGRVTIEGMACGCVLIGKNSGATGELIEHKQTGFLYNSDYKNLAKQMAFVLENQELCNEIRQNAFEFVKENFSTESYVSKVIEAYHTVADSLQLSEKK
ncbi:glycosyltransferase family 4 protein [Bernardetia sp. ABR2-2B]|uniref:glycosyltransferase family 4 protein n=1 Tax=Bernardetia sp. ABR2-2B TaxID=3127472 RepID=UPI0030D18DC2